jgi:hypothetical protein
MEITALANPAALVDTEWLAEHLHDGSIRVIDVHHRPQQAP